VKIRWWRIIGVPIGCPLADRPPPTDFHLRQGAPPARTHFLGVLACIAGVSEPRFRNKIGSFFLALMHHKNGGRSVIACKRKKQREEASTVAFFRNPIQDPGPRTENRIGSRFSPGSHPVLIFSPVLGSRFSSGSRIPVQPRTGFRISVLGSQDTRFSLSHPVLGSHQVFGCKYGVA